MQMQDFILEPKINIPAHTRIRLTLFRQQLKTRVNCTFHMKLQAVLYHLWCKDLNPHQLSVMHPVQTVTELSEVYHSAVLALIF